MWRSTGQWTLHTILLRQQTYNSLPFRKCTSFHHTFLETELKYSGKNFCRHTEVETAVFDTCIDMQKYLMLSIAVVVSL